ncbi:membrane protein insertase YidC [Desulfonema ishimotonii]|uniref:Membrane protein insertase YidC n=2 Tax=Desulfonema ishimotonii TaxID=45657 RepID=A0A401G3M4_9BACT|nr:membrane protein insertase YidC [Desulfonema ishimotonii]
MEQARLLLAIVLSFLVFVVWNFFFADTETPVASPEKTLSRQAGTAAPETPTAIPAPAVIPPTPVRTGRIITVNAPRYTVKISEKGAAVTSVVLKDYRETVAKDSRRKELIAQDLSAGTVLAGFSGGGIPSLRDVTFVGSPETDTLDINGESRSVSFVWASPEGIVVRKSFSFSPDSYLIGMNVTVENTSGLPIRGNLSLSLLNHYPETPPRYGFEGASALIGGSLEQVPVKDIEDKNTWSGKIGWIAIESRYFMTGIVPGTPAEGRMHLVTSANNVLENRYISPETEIAPGTQEQVAFDLFFGPKQLKLLKTFDNGLNEAVTFGMFDVIAKPCLWLMNLLYSIIPNYGLAIIILTILIKIVLWPLGNKSYQSMNEMKKIQPLMAELREKYKDDKQKMNEELMTLYKLYKINPMGGCLPMVLQIPVFFALYRMLYEAIELRHAPFIGWINDLSAPDRLFHFSFSIPFMEPPYGIPVLTIVMGATMLLQQKMSPPPGDPSQAKMMMFMPVVFTFIFINFSSGLVLYWLVNNVLSISQQYYVLKKNA